MFEIITYPRRTFNWMNENRDITLTVASGLKVIAAICAYLGGGDTSAVMWEDAPAFIFWLGAVNESRERR